MRTSIVESAHSASPMSLSSYSWLGDTVTGRKSPLITMETRSDARGKCHRSLQPVASAWPLLPAACEKPEPYHFTSQQTSKLGRRGVITRGGVKCPRRISDRSRSSTELFHRTLVPQPASPLLSRPGPPCLGPCRCALASFFAGHQLRPSRGSRRRIDGPHLHRGLITQLVTHRNVKRPYPRAGYDL